MRILIAAAILAMSAAGVSAQTTGQTAEQGAGQTAEQASGQTGATAASEAARNGARFGDWTLRCVAESVTQTKCALIQRLAQAETNAFIAEIGLNRAETAEGARTLMVLLTPDGTALNLLPAYVVDEGEVQVPLNWRTCANRLCRAAVLLNPEQEAALKAGGQLVMAYQRFGAQAPLRLAVSLNGVTAGLAALAGQ